MKVKNKYIRPILEIILHEDVVMQATTNTSTPDPGPGNSYGAKDGDFLNDAEPIGGQPFTHIWDD